MNRLYIFCLIMACAGVTPQARAVETDRRGFLGFLGGGAAVVANSASPLLPSEAAQTTASGAAISGMPSAETLARTRAHQLREAYFGNSLFPHSSEDDAPSGPHPSEGASKLQKLDNEQLIYMFIYSDIIRDWLRYAPEAQSVRTQVEELLKLLDFQSKVLPKLTHEQSILRQQRIGELRDAIAPAFTQQPWASLDWFKVFGSRFVAAEWRVYDELKDSGFDLHEVQNLFLMLLESTESKLEFENLVLQQLDVSKGAHLYDRTAIEKVIGAISEFAPLLAETVNEEHMQIASHPEQVIQVMEQVGRYELSYNPPAELHLFSAKFKSLNEDLVDFEKRSRLWPGWRSLPYNNSHQERFSDTLTLHLRENLVHQSEIIQNLERLPESPLKDLLLPLVRRQKDGTELELLTLPVRLRAYAWYDSFLITYHALHRPQELGAQLEHLKKAVPPTDSELWFHWEPPENLTRKVSEVFENYERKTRSHVDPSAMITHTLHSQALRPNIVVASVTNWVANLLNQGLRFSSKAFVDYIFTPEQAESADTSAADSPAPLAIIHQEAIVINADQERVAVAVNAAEACDDLVSGEAKP